MNLIQSGVPEADAVGMGRPRDVPATLRKQVTRPAEPRPPTPPPQPPPPTGSDVGLVARMYADQQNRHNAALHGQPLMSVALSSATMLQAKGAATPLGTGTLTLTKKSTVRPKKGRNKPADRLVITNKKLALQYSNIIIVALQEALDYDPVRNHNERTPALYIDDAKYKDDIRALIGELKRLNELLERKSLRAAKKPAVNLAKHFDTLLGTYSKGMGWGLSGLTIGAIYALLNQLGLGPGIIGDIFRH